MVWVIKEAWSDSMENNVSAAFGFEVIGYVDTEAEANEILKKARPVTKEQYGWAAPEGTPNIRVKKLDRYPVKKS